MKTEAQSKPLLKQILAWLLRFFFALGLIAVGIYLWAYLSTGNSLVARGSMWGDSDGGDLYRFPTRQMQASPNPVFFEPVSEDILSSLPVTAEAL